MKTLLTGLALSALIAAPAIAADLPPRVPVRTPAAAPVTVQYAYNWSGCYIGLNGGYGSARASITLAGVTESLDGFNGGLAGGQAGCNYQAGAFVFGVEVDGQWADIGRTDTLFGVQFKNGADWFMTARGRVGWAAGSVLFYATGGYAHIGLRSEVTFLGVTESAGTGRGGWTAGGGVEFGFSNNWSLKAEYLYLRSFDKTDTFFGLAYATRVEAHLGRIGVNYRWGDGRVVARY